MYQDNRDSLTQLPECDCKPDQHYPENPDWLYFFGEWEKIKDSVGDLPALIPEINMNTEQRKIYQQERELYLRSDRQKALVPSPDNREVEVGPDGKLYYKPGNPSPVESVNGQTGKVQITPESIGALPADTPIPPEYTLPVATDTRLGGVRAIKKTPEMTDEVGIDDAGHLFVQPSSGPLPPPYQLPVATVTRLGGVKAETKTEEYTEPVAADPQGKLFVKPSPADTRKEVDVYDFPPMPIPEGIQLFVDESEDPPELHIPTKVSELENDAQYEESQTIKVSVPLSNVTSIETLRGFLYNQRKATSRKAQFEYTKGDVNEYLMKILGFPAGVTADDRGFLYIDLPYSEAGGFEIRYRYQLRDKPGIWERVDYSTLNNKWKSTGWYQPDQTPVKEGKWELIEEVTTSEDAMFTRTTEPDGTKYNFIALKVRMTLKTAVDDDMRFDTDSDFTVLPKGTRTLFTYVCKPYYGTYLGLAASYFGLYGTTDRISISSYAFMLTQPGLLSSLKIKTVIPNGSKISIEAVRA